MFDRAWTIICRDASQPVGTVRMMRADADTARARIERARAGTIACAADGDCTVGDSDVAWTTPNEADGDTSYSVTGQPEERGEGKGGCSTCKLRGSPYH